MKFTVSHAINVLVWSQQIQTWRKDGIKEAVTMALLIIITIDVPCINLLI